MQPSIFNVRVPLAERNGQVELPRRAAEAGASMEVDRPLSVPCRGCHLFSSRPQNAEVSATLARVPLALRYVFTVPVCVSVTVIVYWTFESAP